jgi:hypothetical protein
MKTTITIRQLIDRRGLAPCGIETVEDQMDCEMTLLGTVSDGLQTSEVWQSENCWGIGLWAAGSAILSSDEIDDLRIDLKPA